MIRVVPSLLAGALIAAASASSWAQAPDAPSAQSTMPPSTIPSADGEQIILSEFEHRKLMGQLARDLEEARFRLQIDETNEQRKKVANGDSKDAKKDAKVEAIAPPPVVPPLSAGGGLSPVNPAMLSMSGGAGFNTNPKPVGMVGDKVLFRVGDETMSARVGETVGGYTLTRVEGRHVTLSTLTAPVMTLTSEVP